MGMILQSIDPIQSHRRPTLQRRHDLSRRIDIEEYDPALPGIVRKIKIHGLGPRIAGHRISQPHVPQQTPAIRHGIAQLTSRQRADPVQKLRGCRAVVEHPPCIQSTRPIRRNPSALEVRHIRGWIHRSPALHGRRRSHRRIARHPSPVISRHFHPPHKGSQQQLPHQQHSRNSHVFHMASGLSRPVQELILH